VAQASSSWQQFLNQISNWLLPEFKRGSPKQRQIFRRFQEPGGFLGFLTILVAMLLWNWKLLLALLAGVGVMVLVYLMQEWDWRQRWSEIGKFLNSPNRRLALAIASGGIASVTTYMAVAILLDSHSHWIAAGAILQGLGTLITLILLIWQAVDFYTITEEKQLDRLLVNLTETDPLKRMIALRQLTRLVTRKGVDTSLQQEVVEYLRILLSREEEAAIREAVFDSLQALDKLQPLPSTSAKPLPAISVRAKQHLDC
jgi:hypothetical protein